MAVSYRNDGRYEVSLVIWDLSTRARIATLESRAPHPPHVVFTADNRGVYFNSGRSVFLWRFDRPEIGQRIHLARDRAEAWSVVFSGDGRLLVTGRDGPAGGGTIQVWDARTGEPMRG